MRVTKHAKDRLNERAGLSSKSAERMARIALEKGISHAETAGSLNKYLTALYLKHQTADNTRVYGQHVYLFRDDILITVLHLPLEYRAIANKIAKRIAHERFESGQKAD